MPKRTTRPTKKSAKTKSSVAAKPVKKQPPKKPEKNAAPAAPRRRFKLPRPRRRQRPATPPRKLTGSFRLFADSVSLLRQYWKLFGRILLVYVLLTLVLVGGLGGFNVAKVKESFADQVGQVNATISLFSLLLGSAGSTASATGAAYQTIVVVGISLATIWSLRQIMAGKKIGVRDAFYRGMYPLVPFVIVFLFICLQLLTAVIGSFIYRTVFTGGLVVGGWEKVVWGALIFGLVTVSLYFLSSSVIALYVVTLPNMRPRAALRAARQLVAFRRWQVMRKLLFLPLALVVIGAVILLPLIAFAPAVVQWVFALLSMAALIFTHTYIYSLYKELL